MRVFFLGVQTKIGLLLWVGSRDLNGDITAKHRLRPLRRHLSVRRAEMQCERIRKLISRWHRDELGAERKAARRKCSKALAPILDIIRKYTVHASLKAVDASRECPA